MTTDTPSRNWSGNYAYRASAVHRPQSVPELQKLVAATARVRALGSRHSFTDVADSAELVSLERLPEDYLLDRDTGTISVPGHVTYARLAEVLNDQGLALPNLASLPHISVAGAVATATHGSGADKGNLATAVREVEMVTASGELRRWSAEDEDLSGVVVGLGSLGVVTRLTLAVEPFYSMRQDVYQGLSWDALFTHFDDIAAAGDSVSVFHLLGERTEQVWVKRRWDERDETEPPPLFDARPATVPLHPVLGGDAVNCTEQLGVPGPWSERLPHFRSGFLPSAGEELQSEFFVDRRDAVAAVEAVRSLTDEIVPLLLVSELRTIAADELWLSPQYGRPTAALHFTWRRRQAEVEAVVARIEEALAPLEARPHWGKVFTASAEQIAPLYPRLDDFRRLRAALDPDGTFVNDWLRRHVLGPG